MTYRDLHNYNGIKGVAWIEKLNKWQVSLQYKKQVIYLGIFSNLEEAKKVRSEAEDKYFGEFKRNEENILNGKI